MTKGTSNQDNELHREKNAVASFKAQTFLYQETGPSLSY